MLTLSNKAAGRHSEKDFANRLRILSDSGAGVIQIRTPEVVRATLALRSATMLAGHEYREWDIANGFRKFDVPTMFRSDVQGDGQMDIHSTIAKPLNESLETAPAVDTYIYYAFVNPHYWMERNPVLAHYIQQMAHLLPSSNRRVVFITPDMPLPEPIVESVVTIRFDSPSHDELKGYLAKVLEGVNSDDEGDVFDVDEHGIERICYAGAGLPKDAFELYASLAIVDAATSDDDKIVTADDISRGVSSGKTEVVSKNDILELYEAEDMANVGGMENIKEWVRKRAGCYTDEAKAFGIEAPKGVVLVGHPGCQPAGSLVLMDSGAFKKIEDVCIGDVVLSPQTDGTVSPVPVARTVIYRDQHIYRVRQDVPKNQYGLHYLCAHNHVMPFRVRSELHEMQVTEFLRQTAEFRSKARMFDIDEEHYKFKIKPAGKADVYGITLEHGSHWYVTDDYLVTKNTGKSLCAKAIAFEFGVPLVRLDFGRVFNSLVGQSEQRIRTALRMCEAMAPVVILADEVDKGLGGAGGAGDSGTSSRVLGTFLTWMQDNKTPTFVVASANDITKLPPELLRKGRFDEIFATGFPTVQERREVLAIHLRKRGYNIESFPRTGVQEVVNLARGYVPAELEAAVKAGLIDAYSAGQKFSMTHVAAALRAMIPMSTTYSESVQRMALWMKQNAIPASRGYEDLSTPDESNVTSMSSTRSPRLRTRKPTTEPEE